MPKASIILLSFLFAAGKVKEEGSSATSTVQDVTDGRKREEGRGKKAEGRKKKEEGRGDTHGKSAIKRVLTVGGAGYIYKFQIPGSSVREYTQTNIINLPSQFLCKPRIAELLFALLRIIPVKIPTGRYYSAYYQFVNCRRKT